MSSPKTGQTSLTLYVLPEVAYVVPLAPGVAAEAQGVPHLFLDIRHATIIEGQLFPVRDLSVREHTDRVVVPGNHRHSVTIGDTGMREPRAVVALISRVNEENVITGFVAIYFFKHDIVKLGNAVQLKVLRELISGPAVLALPGLILPSSG
jgi:hypothetical protein